MCAAKSPISILQELTVRKHMPFPQYQTMPQGTGFKCIGSVGTLSASAIAENKKRAKHLCAEHILNLLEPQQSPCNNVTIILNQVPTVESPIIRVEQVHVTTETPNFNAVGKLNELCSQNGISYPNYEEAGVVQQKYVIRCSLLSHVTQGQASTKKQAKQMAAKEMLSRVTSPDFHNVIRRAHLEQAKLKPTYNPEVDENILMLIKQLSTKAREIQLPGEMHINPFSQTRDLFPNPKPEEPKAKIEKEEELTEEELKEQLRQLGIAYRILEFQQNPLVLVLKTYPTKKHPQYTFMHSADTYKLAHIGLLKKAVRDVKLMQK